MEYHFLGTSGIRVSELCLGTVTFGREVAGTDARLLLDQYAAAGGTFIDTADSYSGGAAEEIVGGWLAGRRRDDFVLVSKVRWPTGDGPNQAGLSRKHILASIEGSLRRLGTEYVDVYLAHCWDDATPVAETLATFDSLVRRGMVRYVGVSNFAGWQLQQAIDLCQQRGWEPPRVLQPLYNLLDRTVEWELIPVCQQAGVAVTPWSPLRGGWLSGRFRRGMTAPPPGSRAALAEVRGGPGSWSAYRNEHTWSVLDALFEVADEVGRPPAQVAIRWLCQRPGVTAPVLGVRSREQLEVNLGAAGWRLDPVHQDRLTKTGHRPPPYPHDVIARGARAR